MFKAKFSSVQCLKNVVDSFKDIVSEGVWKCTKEGISMQATDSAHVSVCLMHLNTKAFAEFQCEQDFNMGLSFKHLSKILKNFSDNDSVTLYHLNRSKFVSFTFQSKEKTSIFNFKMMDIKNEDLLTPTVDYSVKMRLLSNEFRSIVDELATFGDDYCFIQANKELGVEFSVGDPGNRSIIIKSPLPKEKKQKLSKQECKASFLIKYLQLFTKASPVSDYVCLKMSADQARLY